MNQSSRLSGVIGLARKAGKLVFGGELTVKAIRSGRKPALVCLASDASDNTVKRIADGCAHHRVELARLPIGKAELGRCIGHTTDVSVVAITDENFRTAVYKQLEMTNASGEDAAGGAIHGIDED